MFIPVWGLGCVRHQKHILGIVLTVCGLSSNSAQGIYLKWSLGLFFRAKTACPSLLIVKAVRLWYLVIWSRVCMCFSCTDGLKLKCSRCIGYLRSCVCWMLFVFEASLNSSAKKKKIREGCSCWPDTSELQTMGFHHTSGTSNGFAYAWVSQDN